ncbi:Integrase protein family protein (plasmid) [Borrelia crocidurae DOU]|uniref:Integrase protein family protein n=3 Tax=Borrelia crocidurae DOU TaxID=1293575 RepID=W5SKL3_9SPIR|nr:site-specific integrase [Borrelia crocidurae]AHH07704.1 Integrase protein family protein [Borrelia crocidurae DOU]
MREYEILKAKIKELEKQNSILRKETRQYKKELLQTKSNTKSKSIPIRFYLNDKTIRLVKKSINKLKQIDPISGWFVHILSITGCRGAEIQNIRLDDIVRETNNNGDVFYSLRVNVAKKRTSICIREVVISKSEFEAIEEIHKLHFKNKGQDSRRTYLFQKSKHRFKDNRINISEISKQFKELLTKLGFKYRKSLHICRNIFIATLKSKGYNSFEIKELMKYASTAEIDNVYGLSKASKLKAYHDIKDGFK